MFSKETYMARRAKLKQTIGSGLLLFLSSAGLPQFPAANCL